jgi:hypothetical protein
MAVLVLLLAAGAMLATLVVLGWVPDTREAGRQWYPAAADLDPEANLARRAGAGGRRSPRGPGAREDRDAGYLCCIRIAACWFRLAH